MPDRPPLIAKLESLRSRVRRLAVATGFAGLLAVVIGWLIVCGLVDYVFNLPGAARVLLLLVGLAGAGLAVFEWIIRPAIAKLTVGDVAGRVEATFPQFDDRLRSTVNFLTSPVPGSDVMKQRVAEQTATMVDSVDLSRVVVAKPLYRAAGTAGGAFALAMLILLVIGPNLRGIAMSRLFHPLGDAKWPRSVQIAVQSETPTRVTAGQRVYIRMKLARGDRASRKANLFYQYDGQPPVQELMSRDATGTYAGFHDAKLAADAARGAVKIWIEAGDDRVDLTPIQIVPKLSIASVTARITPPPYAALPATQVDLRQTPAVVAAGGGVELRVTFNKALSEVPIAIEPARPEVKLPKADITRDGDRTAVIRFSPRESTELRVRGTDIDAVSNESTESYVFTVRPDQNPTVLLENPRGNEERTAVATVPLQAVAEDDYGIASCSLLVTRLGDHRKWTVPLVSQSAPAVGVAWAKIDGSTDLQRFRLNTSWDLSKLETANLQPGDVLEYGLAVTDNFTLDGQTHAPAYSGKLRITIISQETLSERIVDAIRSAARQTNEERNAQQHTKADTSELADQTKNKKALDDADRGTADRLSNEQSSAASQSKQIANKLQDLIQRMDENKSAAQDLRDTARDVADQLNRIADGSQKDATDKLNAAKQNPATPSQDLADASQKQSQAADELQKALDRMGNVGTLANTIDTFRKLLDDQSAASAETARIGKSNLGKTPSEMKPEDKKALDKNVADQKSIAERTQNAIDEMKKTADQLAQTDPPTSQAMKAAADAAQQQQVTGSQSKAAQAASDNRQSQAQAAQKQAELGLQIVLAQLKEAERRKLEQLAAQLTELSKQVAILVRRQAGHNLDNLSIQGPARLAKLEKDVLADLYDKSQRDPKNVQTPPTVPQLTASQEQTERNTRDLSKSAEDVNGGAEVSASLARAASRMGAAIVWLRQSKLPDAYDPPQVEALYALTQGQKQLDELLKKATNKLEQQQKDAVRAALQKIRDDQAKLNTSTATLEKAPKREDGSLRREDALTLAGLPGVQGKLIDRLKTTGDDLASVGGTVFVWLIKDTSTTMGSVKDELAKPDTGKITQAGQARIVSQLDAMIAALSIKPPEQRFEQQSGGGSGGGGGAQKLPSEAQLRLLKSIQETVNAQTKLLDSADAKDKAAIEDTGGRQGEIRSVLSDMLKKSSGKPLGAEPDPSEKLPEENGEEALNNDELQGDLLGGAATNKPGPPPSVDKTQRAGNRMGRARQRLALSDDPGKTTQLIQQKILEDMDDLIAEARKQESQSSGKPSPGKGDGPPKPGDQQGAKPQNANGNQTGTPQGGTTPAAQSSLGNGGAPQTDITKDIHEKMGEWGGITQRQRDAVMEARGEQVIEKYRNYLDDYYKSLATQTKGTP